MADEPEVTESGEETEVETEEVETELESSEEEQAEEEGEVEEEEEAEETAPDYLTRESMTEIVNQMNENVSARIDQAMRTVSVQRQPPQSQPQPEPKKTGIEHPTQEQAAEWTTQQWIDHTKRIDDHHDGQFASVNSRLDNMEKEKKVAAEATRIRTYLDQQVDHAITGLETFIDKDTGKRDEEMIEVLQGMIGVFTKKHGIQRDYSQQVKKIARGLDARIGGRVKKKTTARLKGPSKKKVATLPKGSGTKPEENQPKTLAEAHAAFKRDNRAIAQEEG